MSQVPTFSITRRRLVAIGAAAAATVPFGFAAARQATPDGTATLTESPFLDPTAVHDVVATFSQEDYDAMIQAYIDTADKEWIEATVTIDGSTYEQAGMRLKGNSSLMGLRGGPGGNRAAPEGEDLPDAPDDAVVVTNGGDLGADTPERLPWLVRLDKFVDGQEHDGIAGFVIRANNSRTALNEAVALDLLSLAGLASQQAAYTRFTVNDSDPALRLAIENPDDAWMLRHFPNGGLLYKAEAGGDYSYRGDDPASYTDVFDLEAGDTGDDQVDFTPLTGFLQFINESDDETFATGLPDHLDTEGFATYLAMMDLIANGDDIDGPGNNAYLHVDPDSTQFVVVPWDMNLAFGGPGGGAMTRTFPDDGSATPDAIAQIPSSGGEDRPMPGGDDGPTMFIQAGPGGSNILVERWNEVAAMTGLVTDATARLRDDLFTSGTAGTTLNRWVDVLVTQATDILDTSTIESESAQLAEFFTTT